MDDEKAGQRPDTGDRSRSDHGDQRRDLVEASSPAAPAVPTPGFSKLEAPQPAAAAPPIGARVVAFGAIIIGGLLGGLVGYGIGDLLYPQSLWSAVAAVLGALTGAIGLGVLANLTLRAMNEWRSVTHPEAADPGGGPGTDGP